MIDEIKMDYKNLKHKCRMCLIPKVDPMTSIDGLLKPESSESPTIVEAIELVMSEKVNLSSQYPQTVCILCLELLRIAYNLKLRYTKSQDLLDGYFYNLKELQMDDDMMENSESSDDQYEPGEIKKDEACEKPNTKIKFLPSKDSSDVILEENEELDYKCHQCGNSYKTKNALFSHSQWCEPRSVNKIATRKNVSHSKGKNSPVPSKDLSDKTVKGDNRQMYKCQKCNKEYKTVDGLFSHSQWCVSMKEHKGVESDSSCEIVSVQDEDLLDESFKEEPEEQYKCNWCHQSYRTKQALFSHTRWCFKKDSQGAERNKNESRLKCYCSICGIKFRYERGLQNHLFIHYKEKNAGFVKKHYPRPQGKNLKFSSKG